MNYPQGGWGPPHGYQQQNWQPPRPPKRNAGMTALYVVLLAGMMCGIGALAAAKEERRLETTATAYAPPAPAAEQPPAFVPPPMPAVPLYFSEPAVRTFVLQAGCTYPERRGDCSSHALSYESSHVEGGDTVVIRVHTGSIDNGQVLCSQLAMNPTSPAFHFPHFESRGPNDEILARGHQGQACVRRDASILRQMGL